MDDQMRALYLHKLHQEKAGKPGKGRKQIEHLALLLRDKKALLSSMNALDKPKLQGMELVGITTNQFRSLKCQTSNSMANSYK